MYAAPSPQMPQAIADGASPDWARLDLTCVNTLRFLYVHAVEKAKSGHPGLPMGAAAMAYMLWTHFLRHNPANPHWFDRDRFVLSAGHGSALLYSLLHLTGYTLSMDEIKRFRQWGSLTPGHPERDARRRGDHRAAGPGFWQWRGHGNGRGALGGLLQPARLQHRRSFHLWHRQRWRFDGRRGLGNRIAGRTPATGQADLPLRRQSCHAVIGHGHGVYLGPRRPLRGLRLAHALCRRWQRSCGHRQRPLRGAKRNAPR